MNKRDLISVNEAAKRLGCTVQNVRWLLARGKLEGWQVNRRAWIVCAKSVAAYGKR